MNVKKYALLLFPLFLVAGVTIYFWKTKPVTVDTNTSADERMAIVYENLHTPRSGDYVRASFTDLEFLFEWQPDDGRERRIYPFRYYYSSEADATFVICNIEKTVAICDGIQETPIQNNNVQNCTIATQYIPYL